MPAAMITPSGRVPEQGSRTPELGFRNGGGSVSIFAKYLPSPTFLGQGVFVGDGATRGEPRGAHATPRRGSRWDRAWGPRGYLADLLRLILATSFPVYD